MPTGGKTSKLISISISAAQQVLHKTADCLDKLKIDPAASHSSSSAGQPQYSYPPPSIYPYPPGAATPPQFYPHAPTPPPPPPPPPPPSNPPGTAPTPPPPPSDQPFAAPPNSLYSPHRPTHAPHVADQSSYASPPSHPPSSTSYPSPPYPGRPPSYEHAPNTSTPSLRPPPAAPHHPSHPHDASASTPNLYPLPSPSAPPLTPPPGYPQPPQPSHALPPKYYSRPAHNSSPATVSQQNNASYDASHLQRPYVSAPDLPSPEYDQYQPASPPPNSYHPGHIPHSHSSPAVPVHYPSSSGNHVPSRPSSRYDPVGGRLNASPPEASQPAPEGYPHPPCEADSESYHTANAPLQSPFILPSALAGTPDYPHGSPSAPYSATPYSPTASASEGTGPPSPSVASTCQMSCAAFKIVPVRTERPSETPELFMEDLLEEAYKRQNSVAHTLGRLVLDEACKGLSRVLNPADDTDIQMFGIQLRRADYAACEQDYHRCARDNIPIFAISYTHRDRGVGRNRFSEDQWENFEVAMSVLAKSNVREVRIWLDQCLWLRDSNLGCWAHTGIIPYVIWPVFSLGVRAPERDRTFDSFYRVWPYLEETAALWSLGVITTSEIRQENENEPPSPHTVIRHNMRKCVDPQACLYLLFHAICDGKITDLECACKEDVHELTDMAMFNMDHDTEVVIVGSNWRARTSPLEGRSGARSVSYPRSTPKSQFITAFSSGDLYLDV